LRRRVSVSAIYVKFWMPPKTCHTRIISSSWPVCFQS
jgi:hypothetical protein